MTIQGLVSYQLVDAKGETGSFDLNFVNTTSLLADIVAWLTSNVSPSIDVITDGKIRKVRLSLTVPLPGGLKSTAVAGSLLERTGLYSMVATGTGNAFGVDVPAHNVTAFVNHTINSANPYAAAFETMLTTVANNTYATDKYGNALLSVKAANMTFRKHRKSLSRA